MYHWIHNSTLTHSIDIFDAEDRVGLTRINDDLFIAPIYRPATSRVIGTSGVDHVIHNLYNIIGSVIQNRELL